MSDQRTMRTFLDLVTERDEALGEATRLADLLEEAIEYPEPQPTAAGAALTWLLGGVVPTSPDPFAGHHPEHSTPQKAPTIVVDDSLVRADTAMREQFVAEGGCADRWLRDPSRCVYDGCQCREVAQ